MLAYSSIGHAGFVLIALTAPNQDGIQAAMFYLGVYALTVLGAFGVVMLVSGRGEARTDLASYAGLGRRNPLIAGLMSLFLLSMAGIPPTAGFIAKANAFGAAVRAGHWPLVLIGVIASVAAAFFYIRVIVLMYMTEPSDDVSRIGSSMPLITVCVAGAAVLVLGVFPQLVLGFLEKAAVLRW
jgi:NADH-quinone oxidoreductase subunit N